jgi:phosphoglycolate phosphatase
MDAAQFTPPFNVRMVMLDLDGTLIHTAPDLAESANRMLRDLGMAAYDEPTVASWIGNGVSRLVKRALTGSMDAEPTKELFERGYPRFLAHYADCVADQSRPFPGVVAGLDALQAAGFQLACITNKAEAFTRPLLQQLDLAKYFELVLSGDSLPKRKPDPLPLLHACRHFGIEPRQGVLIGDSLNDVQAARAAGMPVVCVTYGYNRGRDVRELHPDVVVDAISEVPAYLRLAPAAKAAAKA